MFRYIGFAFSHIDGLILAQLRAFKSAQIATRTLKQTFDVLPQTTNKFLHKMVSKNSARAEVKKSTLYSSINDFKDYAEIAMHKPSRISYQNALRSGRMYRLYKEEKSGLEVLPQNKDRINSILCSKGDIFDNLFQYRKYKEAFGLQ